MRKSTFSKVGSEQSKFHKTGSNSQLISLIKQNMEEIKEPSEGSSSDPFHADHTTRMKLLNKWENKFSSGNKLINAEFSEQKNPISLLKNLISKNAETTSNIKNEKFNMSTQFRLRKNERLPSNWQQEDWEIGDTLYKSGS